LKNIDRIEGRVASLKRIEQLEEDVEIWRDAPTIVYFRCGYCFIENAAMIDAEGGERRLSTGLVIEEECWTCGAKNALTLHVSLIAPGGKPRLEARREALEFDEWVESRER
jgi:hypothetical protein